MEAEFRNEALLGLCRAIEAAVLPPDGRLEFNCIS